MEGKILGIDLGTSSIGLSVRNADRDGSVADQLDYFTSVIFEAGVGVNKSGEFSRAAERTSHRSSRRLLQARRYRIWRTLEVLIENNLCPLSMDDLNRWRIYDKSKGLTREYPVNAEKFEQWVRLDFNFDNIPDYSSPYQLREELATRPLDLSQQLDRFKLGRALYHIAQRRGFKSSKGETMAEQESTAANGDDMDLAAELQKSEAKKSKGLIDYMKENKCPTVGCAFALMERNGVRVRANDKFQAVRSQYFDEIKYIFDFQGITPENPLYNQILSRKKGEGSIFFKRPLRSQKGTVGKCTLEPRKSRCPLSRPEFEFFRAWSLINNIRYRLDADSEWLDLDLDVKQLVFNDVFNRSKSSFKFSDIHKYLDKHFGRSVIINYKDNVSVSGCPVSYRFKRLLGDNWLSSGIPGHSSRQQDAEKIYSYDELWHVCFSADEAEEITDFITDHLNISADSDQAKDFLRLWGTVTSCDGYANLSLKAINAINRFLAQGLIYTDAVLLAKVPEFVVDNSDAVIDTLVGMLPQLKEECEKERRCYKIANDLIASYKNLPDEEKFGFRDTSYQLDNTDRRAVLKASVDAFTKAEWNKLNPDDQLAVTDRTAELYQSFFADEKRDFLRIPKLNDYIARFICDNFSDYILPEYRDTDIAEHLYHPSAISIYKPAKPQTFVRDGVTKSALLLGSPKTDVFRNPVVMRALHILRRQVNNLIEAGMIDESTRVVVETAREFNDANMRWAIEAYQRIREEERKKLCERLREINPSAVVNDDDIQKVQLLIDQASLSEDCEPLKAVATASREIKYKEAAYTKDITRYQLWLEQKCRSVYTGKIIPLSQLFDGNAYDIEHTIPRSLCFDDSLANKTICEADFNRKVKLNRLPNELDNYDEIMERIKPWIVKRDRIADLIVFWRGEAKKAATKDRKDYCIRQRHLWQMEYDYWADKVSRFTKERDRVNDGFRNSQLVDTRIITKYAMHFLKTVFSRVDVQRGETTADFRRALGIQALYEKKSRNRHSHHAIDATMLTLIPTNKDRDRLLELFYENAENTDNLALVAKNEKEMAFIRSKNNIHDAASVASFIEDNILIRHMSSDQTLSPAKRKLVVHGKTLKDEKGNPIYVQSDSIRGQINKETYYGAIKYPLLDENGDPVMRDGMYVYEKDDAGNDKIRMVSRCLLNKDSFKKIEDFDKIVDPVVRNLIKSVMNERINAGASFVEAIGKPIYMRDSSGNDISADRNGRPILPIRHVRCYVAAGRGYMTAEKALALRSQTYRSVHDYKNTLYAQNDGNYLCLLYEGFKKEKLVRKMRFVNYHELSLLTVDGSHVSSINAFFSIPGYSSMTEGSVVYDLKSILRAGTMVIMLSSPDENVRELDQNALNKRLFKVYKFNNSGADYVYLQNSIEARSNNQLADDGLKGDGDVAYDSTKYQHRLKLGADKCNFLIEDVDFHITTNGIEWI